jgi:hypothetical protein
MITSKIQEFVAFLASSKRVLILSNRDMSQFMDIFDNFEMAIFEGINENSIKNLSFNFTKNHIDIVIFAPDEDFEDILSMYGKIKGISNETEILLILPEYCKTDEIVEIVDTYDVVMGGNFSREVLLNRLFRVLSAQYAVNNVNFVSEALFKDVENNNKKELEEFLDVYEGAVIFLIDNLAELIDQLKNGNLSQELLQRIGEELMEVHEIFSIHNYTRKIAPIFQKFSEYLKNLKLEDIDVENLEAFNYLTDILEDINIYLKDYFIDRIFQDVYIFQHSLESNIEFLEAKLAGKEDSDDEDSLEFF